VKGVVDLERTHQRLIDTHHGAGVVELSAVVRRREQSHQLTLGKELIAVLNHLSITPTTHTVTPLTSDYTQTDRQHYDSTGLTRASRGKNRRAAITSLQLHTCLFPCLIMVALCNTADHYIFALLFLSSSIFFFFPHLISAAAGWMSTIL